MQLAPEDLDPIGKVTQEALREILEWEVFGKFAILADSPTSYMQAACDWQPTDEGAQFVKPYGSDPWILEYREGQTDTHFRANGYRTRNGVIEPFSRYLARDDTREAILTGKW